MKSIHEWIRPYKTRLVLIHSPTFNFESFDRQVLLNRGYYAYPPRALQCLQVSVKDLIDCDILDLNYLMLKHLRHRKGNLYQILIEILDEHLDQNPETRLYGVSTGVIVPNIFDFEKHPFLEILSHLKKRHGIVMVGGAAATIEARNLIEGGWADLVFKGEAETRLRYALDENSPPVSGIGYWNEGYEETTGSNEMVNFQKSIIESYQSIPIRDYHEVGCLSPFSRMVDDPFCTIQLIRGCRMKCTFCGLSQYRGSNEVCEYPHYALFEEIKYLVEERGIRHFSWLDEDLLAGIDEVKSILKLIIEHDLDITWSAPTGLITVYIDEELLDLMAQSGCIGFRIGIESGNREMLKQIRKPGTLDGFRKISRLLSRYPQFQIVGLYMLGFENETYGQMFDTLNFSMEMNISWSHFSVYQEIKETDFKTRSIQEYRDWLPSPEKVTGASQSHLTSIRLSGKEVFALPRNAIHDPRLKQEIWFAFNLIANYLCNKDLKPEGNLDNFMRWMNSLQMTYPHHPVISLFLSIGHHLKEEFGKSCKQYLKTIDNLEASEYWKNRFEDYDLNRLLDSYPSYDISMLSDIVKSYENSHHRGE